MNDKIAEEDWQRVRDLPEGILNRACDEALQGIEKLAASRGQDNLKCYNQLWKFMREKDEKITQMFDDFKRSNAVFKLAMWRKNGLLPQTVYDDLTEETQNHIDTYNHLSTRR